jgi:hypothetical protein
MVSKTRDQTAHAAIRPAQEIQVRPGLVDHSLPTHQGRQFLLVGETLLARLPPRLLNQAKLPTGQESQRERHRTPWVESS